MTIGLLGRLTVLSAIAMAAAPAWAGEYTGPGLSADFRMQDVRLAKGRITGRYYMDRGGSRMDFNRSTKHRSLIFNSFSRHLITVSRKGSNIRVNERRGRGLAAQFGDAPCGGYAKARLIGAESRFGRPVKVWRCERPQQAAINGGVRPGSSATIWYDVGLKHFIRKEYSYGPWIELRNIRTGRQAPSRFDSPSEFKPLTFTAAPVIPVERSSRPDE